jgi:hypothetical protein
LEGTVTVKRKIRRNRGPPYASEATGKTTIFSTFGTKCTFTHQQAIIFNPFWVMSNINSQNSYLFTHIKKLQ